MNRFYAADESARPAANTRVDGRATDFVPADDRGLAYADGVFRTLVVDAGRPVAWAAQYERLRADCARLDLAQPPETSLCADLDALFAGQASGVARITITRAGGGRGYAPPSEAGIRRIVTASALPERSADTALELDVSAIELAAQPALAGVKHLARLEQVLARAACERAGCADAAMCEPGNSAGRNVVCTTMRNLLFVDGDGRWVTPILTRAGVAGATRARLMRALADAGEPVVEADVRLADLRRYVGAIATNSVAGVSAAARVDDVAFDHSEALAERVRNLLVDSA